MEEELYGRGEGLGLAAGFPYEGGEARGLSWLFASNVRAAKLARLVGPQVDNVEVLVRDQYSGFKQILCTTHSSIVVVAVTSEAVSVIVPLVTLRRSQHGR